jgi:hypothetical protein
MLEFDGEREKVCIAVATEIITLPGHLRVLFDKVYEGEQDSGTGWTVWQRVLQARIQEPLFSRRLAMAQLECRTLRQEVDGLPIGGGSVTPRTKTSWIEAIDQLTSLTVASDFHLPTQQWKEKARQSDITLLDTMHVYYNLHNMFVEIDLDQVKDLAARLNSLSDTIKTSDLNARVKIFFIRALEALKFSLDNMVFFGFDSAWNESVTLVGAVLRFRNELASNSELRQKVAATAWQAMQFLALAAGAEKGAVPISEAAQALLDAGAPPAI